MSHLKRKEYPRHEHELTIKLQAIRCVETLEGRKARLTIQLTGDHRGAILEDMDVGQTLTLLIGED